MPLPPHPGWKHGLPKGRPASRASVVAPHARVCWPQGCTLALPPVSCPRLLSGSVPEVMAVALNADEIKTVMETAAPDLKFLLDREGIALITQARIVHAGITTMRQFGAFFTSAEDLRKVAKDSLGLDPDVLAQRVELSKLVVSWESAKVRATKLAEAEAEAEIRQEAKQLKGTDVNAIRKAYEAKWWKLEEEQTPAKCYLEKISEGVERGELRAELLSEVINKIQGETDVMKAVWDPSGTIKAVKSSPSAPLPRDPEELRTRVTLMGRAWAFVALMQPNAAPLPRYHPSGLAGLP